MRFFAALGIAPALLWIACGGALPPGDRPIPRQLPTAERENWRRLPFDGASNFRDLGGYETRDGRRVRWGVLYRSDALDELSDDDVAYLERLDLATLIDFRSDAERDHAPDRLPAGLAPTLRPVQVDGTAVVALQDRILSGDLEGLDLEGLLADGNRAFALEFGDTYSAFLRDLADAENLPAAFHCTAGKDRAGYGAALALLALGVPREEVMRDYLMTNHYTAEHVARSLFRIRLFSYFRTDPEQVRPLLEVRREYLQAGFDAIDERWGSVDVYLEEGLGIDDATRDALRANLLESSG